MKSAGKREIQNKRNNTMQICSEASRTHGGQMIKNKKREILIKEAKYKPLKRKQRNMKG